MPEGGDDDRLSAHDEHGEDGPGHTAGNPALTPTPEEDDAYRCHDDAGYNRWKAHGVQVPA